MKALTMDYQLTVNAIAHRAETLFGERPVIGYDAHGTPRASSWSATIARARRLAAALQQLGVGKGERVATLCWNSEEHLVAYFGVPMLGAVLHTLNTRMSARELAFVLGDADSRVLIADAELQPLVEEIRELAELEHVILVGPEARGADLGYAALLEGADPSAFRAPPIDERDACALCYTTGTTGAPKGVAYSHRALAIQSLALMTVELNGIRESDVVLVLVPMFHANAWGHPYAAALAGAALVLPHRDLSPTRILDLIGRHRVTHTGGVPTIWRDVLTELDRRPDAHDTSSLRLIRFGGDRVPESVMRGFEERHGIPVVHGYGMTEMSPMGAMAVLPERMRDADDDVRWRQRIKQGRPIPFLEVRARSDSGLIEWDGEQTGELEVRGPSVAGGYVNGRGDEAFTDDGWLRTGDIVSIDRDGFIEIRDRAKDLIKSGGEWISSLALEESLRLHPAVADAAVIGMPDSRWGERPCAFVVAVGACPSLEELREHLGGRHPRWWLPDRVEFVTYIPRTAVGKIRKEELRARYRPAGCSSG